MINTYYGNNLKWWYGLVVNTENDPLELGRAKVRITGIHSDTLDEEYLPWASVVVPTTEGGVSGIGQNPGLKHGARVIGFFLDGTSAQNPIIWGSVPAIEGSISPPNSAGVTTSSGPRIPSSSNLNRIATGYPSDLTQGEIEQWITTESNLRNITNGGSGPLVSVAVFRAEGAGSYQSNIERSGNGSLNGLEASFGPYQLFTGGGLGNSYELKTGRSLVKDNTRDGILNQIRFALDEAVRGGWSPWYGFDAVYGAKRNANNSPTDEAYYRRGLDNAIVAGNWS